MKVFRELEDGSLSFYCPGCKCDHFINKTWTITGNELTPTVTPSILVNWVSLENGECDSNGDWIINEFDGRVKGAKDIRCHLYIKEGQIQYLGDCSHEYAGKIIPMEIIDESI